MSKKRNDKESMICLTPKQIQSFFVHHIQSKEKILTEKQLFEEKWEYNLLHITYRGDDCSDTIFIALRDTMKKEYLVWHPDNQNSGRIPSCVQGVREILSDFLLQNQSYQ